MVSHDFYLMTFTNSTAQRPRLMGYLLCQNLYVNLDYIRSYRQFME